MNRVFKLSSGIMRNYGHCSYHVYSVPREKRHTLRNLTAYVMKDALMLIDVT
jgi:hypothetical protein